MFYMVPIYSWNLRRLKNATLIESLKEYAEQINSKWSKFPLPNKTIRKNSLKVWSSSHFKV